MKKTFACQDIVHDTEKNATDIEKPLDFFVYAVQPEHETKENPDSLKQVANDELFTSLVGDSSKIIDDSKTTADAVPPALHKSDPNACLPMSTKLLLLQDASKRTDYISISPETKRHWFNRILCNCFGPHSRRKSSKCEKSRLPLTKSPAASGDPPKPYMLVKNIPSSAIQTDAIQNATENVIQTATEYELPTTKSGCWSSVRVKKSKDEEKRVSEKKQEKPRDLEPLKIVQDEDITESKPSGSVKPCVNTEEQKENRLTSDDAFGVPQTETDNSSIQTIVKLEAELLYSVQRVASNRRQPGTLLGPVAEDDKHKKCFIIDLDETLVHSSFKMVERADFRVGVEIDGMMHQVYVLKRPHVDRFLQAMNPLYECVLFTASLAKLAHRVFARSEIQLCRLEMTIATEWSLTYLNHFRELIYTPFGDFANNYSR